MVSTHLLDIILHNHSESIEIPFLSIAVCSVSAETLKVDTKREMQNLFPLNDP